MIPDSMRLRAFTALAVLAIFLTGCGPSKEEKAAQERARFELEEQARQDTIKANKAITEMTKRAFRRRTPEEDAKHQEEIKRQVQEALEAQRKADAAAAEAGKQP